MYLTSNQLGPIKKMPKFIKIAPGPNRFRIDQGTNISNKLLATKFFLVRMPILWTKVLLAVNKGSN